MTLQIEKEEQLEKHVKSSKQVIIVAAVLRFPYSFLHQGCSNDA